MNIQSKYKIQVNGSLSKFINTNAGKRQRKKEKEEKKREKKGKHLYSASASPIV